MADVSDISLCLSIVACAVAIAWPIWSLDASVMAASGRIDRARVSSRVKQYARRLDRDEAALWALINDVVNAAATKGVVIGDTEALWALKAATALSHAAAIPMATAIDTVVAQL